MAFIKNYFTIFFAALVTVFVTKVIFVLYLGDNFIEYSWSDLLYALCWGYKFDVALAAMMAFVVTLLDMHKKLMLYMATFMVLAIFLAQISDIMYFYESSRHMGYEVKDAVQDLGGLLTTAYSQHTALALGALLFTLFMARYLWKFLELKLYAVKLNRAYIGKKLFLIIVSVFLIRGMFIHIPLNPWQSSQIGDVKLAAVALNGTYNSIFSMLNASKELKPRDLGTVSQEEVARTFKALYSDHASYTLKPSKQNIVFFFLESWSAVNIQSYGFPANTTPFFNEMLKHAIRPKGMIAGGHRTTEGVFAALGSFQNPLGKTIAKTSLQDFSYRSIIDILNEQGYSSAFFQGSSKETSGTGSFVQTLGFKESYGKRDLSEVSLGYNSWGVYDQDLYTFAEKKLEKMKEPFVIGINGATTHDDKIPEGVPTYRLSEDESFNKQMNALHYADEALGAFVKAIEAKYPNTLFVFFADHCGGVKGNSFENYLIPFALYGKGITPKFYDLYLSQRDIAPTVLDVTLGDYKKLAPHFTGKSLVRDQKFFADYFHLGILGWIEDHKLVELNTASQEMHCFNAEDFKQKKVACDSAFEALKERARAFTITSQTLLFEGKTKTFKRYRLDPKEKVEP